MPVPKLLDGNHAMRISLQIVRALNQAKVPWCLEHPQNSYIFKTREVQSLLRRDDVHTFAHTSVPVWSEVAQSHADHCWPIG